ncbi:N-acyl-D-amino-acid deacylase [Lutispora thermophila DSM 19022]|uniref:N-acyl-D-amino-acid deacylase n=2 Tax=Lutispora TaxID=667112 RepID=A0A1M6AS87_9FIRM|nr:N-acyl-D-amino-acid deacylase [Lutispora thermophila DSM 19022]
MTHPRAIGTFQKILGQCVRGKGLLTLEKAIHKKTGLPALWYGLEGKGFIAQDKDAVLVIFDPDTTDQQCTYSQPILPNKGVNYVFVRGRK